MTLVWSAALVMIRLNSSKETSRSPSTSPNASICSAFAPGCICVIAALSSLRSMSPLPSVSIESKTARMSSSVKARSTLDSWLPAAMSCQKEIIEDLLIHVASMLRTFSAASRRSWSRACSGVSVCFNLTRPTQALSSPSTKLSIASSLLKASISFTIWRDDISRSTPSGAARFARATSVSSCACGSASAPYAKAKSATSTPFARSIIPGLSSAAEMCGRRVFGL
mmetsp:Transcript_20853/g.42339  ORF Transcript_20853/g.42339 Transcript_20853/m.42339 type:complete len:225 (+) Transcript_20853:262-936(+)